MFNSKHFTFFVALGFLALFSLASNAATGTEYSEDFTGTATNNNWYFFNGACLTAGTSTSTTSPGIVPSCKSIQSSYYGSQNLVGGQNGVSGNIDSLPDPTGSGALRFTNGSPGGYSQNGAIVSQTPFSTSKGLQITFKTITYRGDSGGAGHDGADGISFYLMDASKPAGIGAWGGSLGYTCSNANPPYDGLAGAYVAVGIDEYGNFLNGTSLMPGYAGSNSATGDNTKWGYGYKPGRIGMRGAGSISWAALSSTTSGYGTDPGSSTLPFYPSALATSCPGGGTYDAGSNSCLDVCTAASSSYSPISGQCATCPANYSFNPTTNKCATCPSGSYNSVTNQCENICTQGNFDAGTGKCIDVCALGTFNAVNNNCSGFCTASNTTWNGALNKCETCLSGYTYNSGSNSCKKGGTTKTPTPSSSNTAAWTFAVAGMSSPGTVTPTFSNASSSRPLSQLAVQNTCATGHLWNYSVPTVPVDAGEATLANTNNSKGILDYAPIPNAYTELSSLPSPLTIANESAMKRPDATPIFYNLKITQDGLLSLSYSVSGAAFQPVITNQNISASNGTVPANVLFGFAGSTGGSNNIHEIMCFKAAPSTQSGSSTSVNEKLAAKVQAGTQAYFAYYNQNNWTGAVTANSLIDTAGVVTVDTTANWDASCVLTGTTAADGCSTTGATGPTAAQGSSSRVMLTCTGTCDGSTGNKGIAFQYSNLSATQKSALHAFDAVDHGSERLSFLRGDRTNEITAAGTGLFRQREGILGDVVDSSPIWVGPPSNPYTGTWSDRLPPNPATTPDTTPENTATQKYLQFVTAKQTRLNVVYGGSNDGFLHGFRTGSFDTNGNFVDNATTPNDGKEVFAYMPGATLLSAAVGVGGCATNATGSMVQNIHGLNPAVGAVAACVSPSLDYSSTQYGHNFFVDATPVTDDLFYNNAWHTWLVGGLGAGGAAIYALDITDPSSFSETNAATLVIGEWTPATLSCSTPGGSTCGTNLGNTYGTPQIRRLHNGKWGVIFGNGFGSSTGDAGIYVMTIDPSTGSKTFYYLTTGVSGGNGIAYVSPADLDGDHITDYVYAGDLLGNIWRFDLTSTDPTNWHAASSPMFKTASGQPVTTKLQLVATTLTSGGGLPQIMIEFGTGQKTSLTNSSPAFYNSGTQSLYGVWDWNLDAWNAMATVKYTSLSTTPTNATGLLSPYTVRKTNLQQQTFSASATSPGNVDGTNNDVCWQGSTVCATGNNKFGWYVDLPVTSGNSEQVVFNPVFYQGAFIVNSTVPANNVPTSCAVVQDTGFTYVISANNGGIFTSAFPKYADLGLAGVATSATGTPYVVTTAEGTTNLVYQTVSGKPDAKQINPPSNTKAKRLTWIQLR